MNVTATEAKNRLGQVLEQCQREPVTIEKSGRRHSVLMSAAHYDRLVAQGALAAQSGLRLGAGRAFYRDNRDWVDAQNALVDAHGIPGDEFRVW